MNSLKRILIKNRLLYSYSVLRTFSHNQISKVSTSRRLLNFNQSSLLATVNSATNNQSLAAGMSSANESNIKIVNYDYVQSLKNKNDVLLIDVREPSELKETGVIPGSINVPSGEVENVLNNTSPDEFAKRFGRQKPNLDSPLVFSCRSGKRSEAAAHRAVQLGFKDVSNYSGGWLDWEEKMKQ